MESLCIIGKRGGARRSKSRKHASQNGIMYTVSVLCNKNFPSDDDRITSSETTSDSQIAIGKCVALDCA